MPACVRVRVCSCLSIPPWRWAWQCDNVVVVSVFLQVEIAHISRKKNKESCICIASNLAFVGCFLCFVVVKNLCCAWHLPDLSQKINNTVIVLRFFYAHGA